ncbi:ribbon-helix-helix protein, CopG family [Rhizobium sp. FY34]|uniref:ribbon-helix-helix protein, CopG family n=1 Tax=Rhizobium sp. FY34 TaxID=2562309 RepID=UPI00197D939E|nr:ribbon-helix-helix protein, CopG family [Rhizobium sp. FY34]
MTKFEITLPDHMASEIDDAARAKGLSRQAFVATALQHYLIGHHRWQADIEAALQDVDEERGHDGDDVLDWMKSWGSPEEQARRAALAKR